VDANIIIRLMEQGANANIKNQNGATPLMVASYFGHVPIVNILRRAKAPTSIVSTRDYIGRTATKDDIGRNAFDYVRASNLPLGLQKCIRSLLMRPRENIEVIAECAGYLPVAAPAPAAAVEAAGGAGANFVQVNPMRAAAGPAAAAAAAPAAAAPPPVFTAPANVAPSTATSAGVLTSTNSRPNLTTRPTYIRKTRKRSRKLRRRI
jgi:hypothetical protein